MKLPALPRLPAWLARRKDDFVAPPSRPRGIGLPLVALPLLIGSALLYGVYPWVVQQQLAQRSAEAAAASAAQLAGPYRQQVEARLAALRAPADTLAALGRSGLLPGSGLEAGAADLFPGAVQLRLLPYGYNTPEPDAAIPLGYADLDQLRRAERGEAVPLELLLSGTDQAHLNLLVPVETPRGPHLLVAGFGADTVRGLLAPVAGHVRLVQRADGRELTIASRGAAPPADAAPDHRAALAGTAWELRYWGPQPAPPIPLAGWPGQLYALLVALHAALVAAVFVWLGRMLRHDQADVMAQVVAQADGQPVAERATRLRSFANLRRLIAAHGKRNEAGDARRTPAAAPPVAPVAAGSRRAIALPDRSLFRACDIRGVVGATLTPAAVRAIGRAIGTEAQERGHRQVAVGRDGRLSGPELAEALIEGLRASGCDVVDIGMVPTPVLYYATEMNEIECGVMITGSHNPPEFNGLKVVLGRQALHGQDIRRLRERIRNEQLASGAGGLHSESPIAGYIRRVTGDIRLERPLKVVVDCGNGVAGAVAPDLFRALGCEVTELYCDVDGHFPNHHPDPGQPENLADLCAAVQRQQADLGLAFDGDGDRLGVVDSFGGQIWPDRVMMLFVRDLLSRQPGAEVLFDVKCSRNLSRVIEQAGGVATMWKTGHSLLKAKMRESGAQLACEMSGHFFFAERWYGFDDALYAAARLLELLAAQPGLSSHDLFAALPDSVVTPELMVPVDEGSQHALVEQLAKLADFPDGVVSTVDGLRVDFADGFGLVRGSNTTPNLVLRFEGTSDEALASIRARFLALVQSLLPDAQFPQ